MKFCIDASQPDVGNWLKYIKFAGCYNQHNLVACQISDQVCGVRFLDFFLLWKFIVSMAKKTPNNSAICTTDFGLFAVIWQKTGYRCEMQKRVILMMGYR